MRIDQLLNKLCLVKTRSIVKKACDSNLVKINDKVAKASATVNENDVIEIKLYGYNTIVKILTVPKGNVSKVKAPEYYEMIERIKLDLD